MTSGTGRQAVGIALVLAGLLLFAAQYTDLDLGRWGWPFFVILPGLAFLATGLTRTHRSSAGLVVAGAVFTTLGALLLYQSVTDHWASWAYAWALVAPGAVGAGILLSAMRADEPERRPAGERALVTGVILFLVGFAFFEGVVGVSGRDMGAVGDALVPILVIVSGVWLLFRPSGRQRHDTDETPAGDAG